MSKTTKFKQTEIGPIPEDWVVMRVEDIADVGRGRVISFRELDKSIEQLYPVYSSQTTNNGEMGRIGTYDFDGEYVTWTTDGVNAGKVFYRKGRFNCTNVCGLLKLRIGDARFVARALDTMTSSYVSTNLANPKLMNGVMKIVPCVFPPNVSEQSRIADALDDIDALLRSYNELIEKKKAIKKGAMQELLTGKRRLPGFSGKWVEKRLGDILVYEQPQKYIVKNDVYTDHGVPVLTPGKTFILGYTPEEFGVCTSLPIILFDDFLTISRYIDFNFKVKSSAVKLLRTKNPHDDLYFISQAMSRIKFTPGDHQRHWIGIYSNFTLMMPSTDEQKAISNVLRDMDNEIALLNSQISKVQTIKQGMMQELLTGRVRLEVA